MVFKILGPSKESSQSSTVFRYSRVTHDMHIVELCMVLGVESQLISYVE